MKKLGFLTTSTIAKQNFMFTDRVVQNTMGKKKHGHTSLAYATVLVFCCRMNNYFQINNINNSFKTYTHNMQSSALKVVKKLTVTLPANNLQLLLLLKAMKG